MFQHNKARSSSSDSPYYSIIFNSGNTSIYKKNITLHLTEIEELYKKSSEEAPEEVVCQDILDIWQNNIFLNIPNGSLFLNNEHKLKLKNCKYIDDTFELDITITSDLVIPKTFYNGELYIYPSHDVFPLDLKNMALLTHETLIKNIKSRKKEKSGDKTSSRKVTPAVLKREEKKKKIINRETKSEKQANKKYRLKRKKQRYKKNQKLKKHRRWMRKKFKRRNKIFELVLTILVKLKWINLNKNINF
ncbi:hypothetical protein CPAV1605_996 [seawater metagenome]|uniref:Uncharacterized protein n=1 Tax=seawater metagenome TaxID=1561972 RepID=A0A5E8CKP2_9ZZZZ